jgi:hypothetical protein
VARLLLLVSADMNMRLVCLGVAGLLGCGVRALPSAEVARAESTISAAAAIGAGRNPRATEYLDLAKEEIEEAKKLARDGKAREGVLVLQGAQVDAELGLMIVRAAKARDEARQASASAARLSSSTP